MPVTDPMSDVKKAHTARFSTTHWSVVLAAAGPEGSEGGEAALDQLCRVYWYPLYVFARCQASNPQDAQDLTQGFIARLLEKNLLQHADPNRGRFRSFLLASFKNFMADQHDHDTAQKRGGGKVALGLDFGVAEKCFALEPVENRTPERVFERRWAMTLLERVLDRLRSEFEAAGKGMLFDHLEGMLSDRAGCHPYAGVATRFQMSLGAVKMTVRRMRCRYGELLREEIAHTVDSPQDVEDEIRHFLDVLED